MYVTIPWMESDQLFCVCPSCKALTHVTGAKKPLKVRVCWRCGYWFVEDCDEAE